MTPTCDTICSSCAHQYGDERPLLAAYSQGDCGWCSAQDVPVTNPRDFGIIVEPQPKRKGRGPGKKPPMAHVTVRIPKHVLDHYGGDTRAMRDAWVSYVEGLSLPGKETGIDTV